MIGGGAKAKSSVGYDMNAIDERFSALVGQLITLSQAANVLLPEVAVGMPCTFGEDDIRLALTIFASFSVYGKLWEMKMVKSSIHMVKQAVLQAIEDWNETNDEGYTRFVFAEGGERHIEERYVASVVASTWSCGSDDLSKKMTELADDVGPFVPVVCRGGGQTSVSFCTVKQSWVCIERNKEGAVAGDLTDVCGGGGPVRWCRRVSRRWVKYWL
ncbi:hypothetical protein M8C21_024626 [Ambrosia artemisiifolia]|uniref:Uncharacterized protein n=1 Tax=Ambrosia artemisiifolia TaxID=4212 RepID=A0AAD5CEQ7_AMBAR|nr:hypothetical protein M8C21_024626 [Ambrosia artemisiifolia]